MKKNITILLVLFHFIGNGQCGEKVYEFELVKPWTDIFIDTIQVLQKRDFKRSSVCEITTYNDTCIFKNKKYRFELSKNPVGYCLHYNDQFLTEKDTIDLQFIDSRSINLPNASYDIFKFYYDVKDEIDEESLIFVAKDIGIILQRPVNGFGYLRLIDRDDNERDLIFRRLTELILYDRDFFIKHRQPINED